MVQILIREARVVSIRSHPSVPCWYEKNEGLQQLRELGNEVCRDGV